MSISTWHSIANGLYAATYDSYMAKNRRQRNKREVQAVMSDLNGFVARTRNKLKDGTYHVGTYRHINIRDTKKPRRASVLPYEDRCVQNAVKDAIQPLILRQMTDDMLGGLPGCGVLARDKRHQVVEQMRRTMNNHSLRYYLQGDIKKFYDNINNVVSIRLIERQVKDSRTLAIIRQHLFNQKQLAIGDPFSHLIANLNMSVIIRQAKEKYGRKIRLINFADDFIAFCNSKQMLESLRKDMRRWARELRLHYKPMYVREVPQPGPHDNNQPVTAGNMQSITFCGYKFGPGYVHLNRRTKLRYIRVRHRRRSMGSYQGIIGVADTKHLKRKIQFKDNQHMADKIRRPFAGRPMKIETMESIPHTIVDFNKRSSSQKDCDTYYHVQALADGLGLIVYSTGATKICKWLDTKTRDDLPIRDMKIVHDWSGYYFDGTVYTDAEEEEMIRRQFNIPRN